MAPYSFNDSEKKWREAWEAENAWRADDAAAGKKFYHLVMFPYPSGNLHIGHWYNFAPADVVARKRRMEGWNVMSPIGFDAFGLPAENAAIKRKLHPKQWTYDNIAHMKTQLALMGASFDLSRLVVTADPEYYRWTQWMFLAMLKAGLAYQAETAANWCPSCKTVLANEQVVSGTCERCGSEVIQKHIRQWMFRITKYADELLRDVDGLDWPEKTKTMQRNWIGRSEGAYLTFKCQSSNAKTTKEERTIKVFTTRPDTIFGATYLVLSPEHPLVSALTTDAQQDAVRAYQAQAAKATEIERTSTERDKTGVFTGAYATNPATGSPIPVWISDYVLAHYGTGAIMAVPAHDERDYAFAKKFSLPIPWVIVGVEPALGEAALATWREMVGDSAYTGDGWMADSGAFSGMTTEEAFPAILAWAEKNGWGERAVTYKLHDWIVSRQRYWGAPIPVVHCPACGAVPVPESDLPVLLPEVDDYTPPGDGKSPLARSASFLHTPCPKCAGPAERETDTMDTFVDSSWYFLRYADPKNTERFADPKKLAHWLPVDLYVGGAEHTVMHLLYARFFTKALADMGHLSFREPFLALRHQGMILGEDGEKMSKSRGNVVDPDALVAAHGGDTVRLYLCFMGEYAQGGPWNPGGINGVSRFLKRAWEFLASPRAAATSQAALKALHQAIAKVSADIDALKFNTAVSTLMVALRELAEEPVAAADAEAFTKLLAPFAPFLCEEAWHTLFGKADSIHRAAWPVHDPDLAREDQATVAAQVNGKLRATLSLAMGADEDTTRAAAEADANVARHLAGLTVRKVVFVQNRIINFIVG